MKTLGKEVSFGVVCPGKNSLEQRLIWCVEKKRKGGEFVRNVKKEVHRLEHSWTRGFKSFVVYASEYCDVCVVGEYLWV